METRLPGRRAGRVIVLAAALPFGGHSQALKTVPPAHPVSVDSQPGREVLSPHTLEAWLDALAVAESGNRQWLVHRDQDGQLYYGCLQFHERTFRAYVRKYHLLPNSTRSETMRRIYDCAFQKHLATLMLRDDPANWKHWRRTVEKRVGMPPVSDAQ